METKLYLQMLRKGWWIILLTVLVAVNATLIYSLIVTPRYESVTKLLVSPGESMMVDGDSTISSLDTLDKRSIVATYAEFLNSDKVFQQAYESLGLTSDAVVDYKRTAIILPDASVLEVTVEGSDPKTVAALANAISEKGVNYIRQFYQVYDINPIDIAPIPGEAISPKPVRDVALALVFGLILGAALAILSEQIRIPFDSLRRSGHQDNDSGAINRRHFDRLLELEMMRCKANSDVFSLGLVRLDGLADYIDNVPQLLLQKILQNVTKSLKKDLKGTDVIGRWNDTTFAIILPSTPYNAANKLLEKLRQKLSDPVSIGEGNETIRLEPYVGVARSKEDEVIENFITRVQKDLDEDMYNIAMPTLVRKHTPAPAPSVAASAPAAPVTPPVSNGAPSRLSTLFAAAPSVPSTPHLTNGHTSVPQTNSFAPSYPPAAPVTPSIPIPAFSPAAPSSPAPQADQTSAAPASPAPQVDQTPAAPSAPVEPPQKATREDFKIKTGLYKGDILDFDGPPSEFSQGIDSDLNEMRKHWKAN